MHAGYTLSIIGGHDNNYRITQKGITSTVSYNHLKVNKYNIFYKKGGRPKKTLYSLSFMIIWHLPITFEIGTHIVILSMDISAQAIFFYIFNRIFEGRAGGCQTVHSLTCKRFDEFFSNFDMLFPVTKWNSIFTILASLVFEFSTF